jgi:hypothetical protein
MEIYDQHLFGQDVVEQGGLAAAQVARYYRHCAGAKKVHLGLGQSQQKAVFK